MSNKLAYAAGVDTALDRIGLTKEAVSPQWIAEHAASGMKQRFPAAFKSVPGGRQYTQSGLQDDIMRKMEGVQGAFSDDLAKQKNIQSGLVKLDAKNLGATNSKNEAIQSLQPMQSRQAIPAAESPVTNEMMNAFSKRPAIPAAAPRPQPQPQL